MKWKKIHAYRLPFELILRDSFICYKTFRHIHLSFALKIDAANGVWPQHIHSLYHKNHQFVVFLLWRSQRRDFKRKTRGHQMLHNNYVLSVRQMQRAYQIYGMKFRFICFVIHWLEHWKMRYINNNKNALHFWLTSLHRFYALCASFHVFRSHLLLLNSLIVFVVVAVFDDGKQHLKCTFPHRLID